MAERSTVIGAVPYKSSWNNFACVSCMKLLTIFTDKAPPTMW